MPEFQIGSQVFEKPFGLIMTIAEIDGETALCVIPGKDRAQWFPLASLTILLGSQPDAPGMTLDDEDPRDELQPKWHASN